MVRNFVTGVVLGGVVAAGGLAVISQIAPIRGQDRLAAEGSLAAPEPVAKTPAVPVEQPRPVVADPAPLADAAAETDEPLLRPLTDPDAPPPALVVPDLAQPIGAGQSPVVEGAPSGPSDAPEDKLAALPQAPAEAEETAPPDPVTAPQGKPEAGDGQADTPQAAPEGGQGGTTPEVALTPEPAAPEPAAPEPAAQDDAGSEPATLDTPETPEAASAETPATEAPAMPATLAPDGQLDDNGVEGVTTGRLPSIAPEAAETADTTDPAPEVQDGAQDGTQAMAPADLPPIRRFARSFENPQAKPLFAVLLVDTGAADVARADLAALPFPVTFVLDPLAPGAAEAEAIYRAAGQEVVMLASAIPEGATASDLEQSFAGLEGKLSNAVALIETPEGAFQNDRKLSAEVVTLLAAQGRGLVTFDRGLNAADQVARREGLPSAMIFRSLDDDGEDAPLIRRYLDRAAFKAAQEGEVAVIGTTRPETIAALMEWTVEGRAASVALAPITALMAP